MTQNQNKTSSQYTRKKIENYSYGLNDQIGKGYSSQVYKGRNDETNEPAAIKVIDLRMLKNQINKSLLASQIEILKNLKNMPNILSMLQVYTTKNNTYIITQLCDSDLSKKVKKKLSQSEAIAYMKQIINGYQNIFRSKLIHRDLKPANLLLVNDTLKIADFGFGITEEQVSKPSKYNVGSPLYMAPQSLKKNQYSFKSDVWAIGIIFYEMLTAQTPWKAKNEKQLFKKIESEPIDSILLKKKFNNNSIKFFLERSLLFDKNNRLSPEQLLNFNFEQKTYNISNIHSEKKLVLYDTIKSQSYSRLPNDKQKQFTLVHEKSEKRILNPIKNQQSLDILNPQKKQVNTITLKQQQQLKKQDKKSISKILISEIHFCRFLYKLLMRIKQSSQIGILYPLSSETMNIFSSYTKIIKFKLQKMMQLKQQNLLKLKDSTYKLYLDTSDFKKLYKISKQYFDRYSKDLNQYWKDQTGTDHNFGHGFMFNFLETNTTNLLMQILKIRLEEQINSIYSTNNPSTQIKKNNFSSQTIGQINCLINKYSKDIIILDYLMTSRQLLDILKDNPNDYEKFSKKSRIEQIVQGSTANIDLQLYSKILERATALLGYKESPSKRKDNFLEMKCR